MRSSATRFCLSVALIGLMSTGSAALADVSIGINFVGGSESLPSFSNGGPVNVMQPSEIAGLVPQAFWNNAGIGWQNNTSANRTGTLASGTIRDSIGATVSRLSMTWNGYATFSTSIVEQPGNNRMMKGLLDAGPTTAASTVTITGVPADYCAAGYDLLVYFDGEHTVGSQDRVGRWRVHGGTTAYAPLLGEIFGRDPVGVNFSGTFIEATGTSVSSATTGNYVRFVGLHAPSLTLEALGVGGDVPRAPVNGIQIVSSVPEPGAFGILAVTMFGLGAYTWRRRRHAPRGC